MQKDQESDVDEQDATTYSEQAREIIEDPEIPPDNAIIKLLYILIQVAECQMVSGWNLEDALQLRTTESKKAKKHDA